ncbi:hypothetical protein SAY86_002814 [Trapa natans]|uniref:Uncharacterized protein n=1 Tax=Trapa natans TaxID=22666 RepID=A0AAN7R2U4_TRANT|nr:hypothetical protein SAY86_002814 [Trapa natans]
MSKFVRPRHCSFSMPGIFSDRLFRSLVSSSSFDRDFTEVLPGSSLIRIPKRSTLAFQIPTGFLEGLSYVNHRVLV